MSWLLRAERVRVSEDARWHFGFSVECGRDERHAAMRCPIDIDKRAKRDKALSGK
jgi:hypothetical protein